MRWHFSQLAGMTALFSILGVIKGVANEDPNPLLIGAFWGASSLMIYIIVFTTVALRNWWMSIHVRCLPLATLDIEGCRLVFPVDNRRKKRRRIYWCPANNLSDGNEVWKIKLEAHAASPPELDIPELLLEREQLIGTLRLEGNEFRISMSRKMELPSDGIVVITYKGTFHRKAYYNGDSNWQISMQIEKFKVGTPKPDRKQRKEGLLPHQFPI
jgi:hypothetical protein